MKNARANTTNKKSKQSVTKNGKNGMMSSAFFLFLDMAFVHLHNHSEYSFLDAVSRPSELIETAKKHGQTAIALTDNSGCFGFPEFSKAAKKHGIKPIFGVYFFLALRSRLDRDKDLDRRTHSLLLLAENNEGYRNLLLLSSLAYIEGFYYRPRIDFDILSQHKQ